MKTHTFRGRRFVIVDDTVMDGYVELPTKRRKVKKRELYIAANLPPKETLYVTIHEAMHAEDPKVVERVIERRSRSLTNFLWHMGYRIEKTDG